ncbi:hypothetical protein PanWU01x14_136790, partial [Parasponia andersonii]
ERRGPSLDVIIGGASTPFKKCSRMFLKTMRGLSLLDGGVSHLNSIRITNENATLEAEEGALAWQVGTLTIKTSERDRFEPATSNS